MKDRIIKLDFIKIKFFSAKLNVRRVRRQAPGQKKTFAKTKNTQTSTVRD